ncbi:hypothetical protein [Modestobacter roseus]|uniref:Uncharacterized protein n=1 Tax=Modestobacter roseus TaxID=1181884 RepID=A0A562IXK7_9ACTN|nr:hypothetical protein [Modestobacter roseus]MQA33386.1 hypothetical protein [Modestobacter roseus]TWH75304.1 hypothetical protein JD78_03860 [Modestobacter roseus]
MAGLWWGGAVAEREPADAHLLAAVDRALSGSGAAAELVCTHVDRSAADPRTGVSIRLSGPPADPAATRAALARALGGPVLVDADGDDPDGAPARTALAEAPSAVAGRVLRFPGADGVRGRVAVAELVSTTPIEEVRAVGATVGPDDVVDAGPNGFLRPQLTGGRMTLLVERAVGGVFTPFEIENPHVCCEGGH